jgi:transcriptional regulator NrdR family protein
MGMKCEKCGSDTKVRESRPREGTIRRRRRCVKCSHKFTTEEVIIIPVQKPKPKPAPKKPKRRSRVRKPRFEDLDFDNMTDEEIENALEEYQ